MQPPEMPRRRGRPSRTADQIDETKAEIVRCANAIFQREGFDAVSMRRLAAEAGCTVMTVYKYYPRKIDILRALWANVYAELFEGLAQTATAIADPDQRLIALAKGYVQFWLDRRDHYFLVFMSSNVEQADVSLFVQDDALLARFDVLRDAIAAAAPPGLTEADRAFRTEMLLCALHGIAQNLITISGYPWPSAGRLVEAAVRAVTADQC